MFSLIHFVVSIALSIVLFSKYKFHSFISFVIFLSHFQPQSENLKSVNRRKFWRNVQAKKACIAA